jgi:hypothetical protein
MITGKRPPLSGAEPAAGAGGSSGAGG